MKRILCLMGLLLVLCCAGIAQASIYTSIADNEVLHIHPEEIVVTTSYPYANPIYTINISTMYIDRYGGNYSRIIYSDVNTNGVFKLPSYALPWQYKSYELNVSFYNSMFNMTHYHTINFDYMDNSWINESEIPLYVSIRNADPGHLDYTAHKIQREPLYLYMACNHDERIFQYGGGTWVGGENRSFILFDLEYGNWNAPGSIDDMTYTWTTDLDTVWKQTSFPMYNYISLHDAVFFGLGTSYNNTFVTTDGTMDISDWHIDTENNSIGRGKGDFFHFYNGAVSYLEVFVRPWHLMGEEDGFLYSPGHVPLLHAYGESIGVENFAFIIGLIIMAVFIIIPLGIAIRLDLDLPNFMYSILAITGASVALVFGLFPLWFLVSLGIIVLFLTLLSYKDIMMSAVDSMPTPFRHVDKGALHLPKATRTHLPKATRTRSPMAEMVKPKRDWHWDAVVKQQQPGKQLTAGTIYTHKGAKIPAHELDKKIREHGLVASARLDPAGKTIKDRVLTKPETMKQAKATGRWRK